MILGALVSGFTGYVFLTGKPAGLAPEGFTGPIVPDNATATLVVVFFFVGLIAIVVGLFAWRGHEWARWIGVAFGVIVGLFGLLTLLTGAGLGFRGVFSVVGLIFIGVPIYIVIALIGAWRWKGRPA
jgi:hypothetical protein